jgi:hypothetical protein
VYKLIREELEPIARLPALRTCLTYKKKVDLVWPIAQIEYGSYVIDSKSNGHNGFYILGFFFNFSHSKYICKSLFNFYFFLGIFSIYKEDYETIQMCLKELIEQLKSISEIEIKEVFLQNKFFNGG